MEKSEQKGRGLMWSLSWAGLFVIAVLAIYHLYGAWYGVHVDGRSWIGVFDHGVYYFEEENKIYQWTENGGKQKASAGDRKKLENLKERDLQTADAKYGFFTVEMEEGTEIPVYNLYWQKDQDSERMLLRHDSDVRRIVSDGDYLIVHTDRYHEKRQGKTSCYKILYDEEAQTVAGLKLIDVFYALQEDMQS